MSELREWQKPLTPDKIAWLQARFAELERRFRQAGTRQWDGVDWPHVLVRRRRRGW